MSMSGRVVGSGFSSSLVTFTGLLLLLLHSCESSDQHEQISSRRLPRSFKDALPKDDEFSQARAVTEMRNKIFTLEHSMKTANTEITDLSTKNTELEVSLLEQKTLLSKLDGEFGALKNVLESHASTLGELESLTSPGDNLFVLSNQTCGGILVGQSGSIVFSNYDWRNARYPGSCIWTIRANNRAFIKVTSTVSSRTSYPYLSQAYAYVVEIQRRDNNGTANNATVDDTDAPIQAKITRIQRHLPQIFKGPVIFIVYHINTPTDDYTDMDLHLQFEGLGKLSNKSTHFSHASLTEKAGQFSDSQIKSEAGLEISGNSTNFTQDYTTLVISNFTTKVHLQVALPNGKCAVGDSFLVITDLLEESQQIVDCCLKRCEGNSSLINYDNPFVILVTKKFQSPLPFNLTWEAETPYPSTSKSELGYSSAYTYKCGEVLGGTSGSLLYKPHVSYRNGERCIWVIVPQPRPRSTITITVGANGVESTYDHLYMMELNNAQGEPLDSGPRITRIGRYGTYEAHGRELYIVFYSDSSVTGYGFSLSWRSSGAIVKSKRDVTTRFTILKGDYGSATSLERKSPVINDAYEVFILTPVIHSAYIFGMQLHINQTSPRAGGRTCLNEAMSVFTALDGLLKKTTVDCMQPGKVAIENADGLGMIILENRLESSGSPVAMNFSWRETYGDGNGTYSVIEDNNCGGVIKGEKGILKYKISLDYQNNERCVWLIHSPNSTSITLKLQKDGFETCCDYLLVTGVEPRNGTLKTQTFALNRSNRSRTFEENLLIVTFRSDGSTRGRGFALQYAGSGEATYPPRYRYQLSHHNEPFGSAVYPSSSDWEEAITPLHSDPVQDIFLIASSLKVGIDDDPLMIPTNISWSGGLFKRDMEGRCTYDSITFYTTPDPAGWLLRERYPNDNDTATCPDHVSQTPKEDIFSTVYSAFIAIYKPLSREDEGEENDRKVGFTFEKTAGCGGVIIGDSGEISYKEAGRYSNLEKCLWLVQAPQASRIRFTLERSGFEECCDVLIVYTFNPETGALQQASIISQGVGNRTTTVAGPVAIVVFTSDSSVVGEGFRLAFTTQTQTSSEFPYTYHLEHKNQPKENSFITKVEPNQITIIGYSPEIFHRSGSGYLGQSTQLNLYSFRPQISGDCESDTLTIYDVFRQGISSSARYQADLEGARRTTTETTLLFPNDSDEGITTPATNEPQCSALRDSNYNPCDNFMDCEDPPNNNLLNMNTTSFLAIYKSVNETGAGLRFRGFVLFSEISNQTATYGI